MEKIVFCVPSSTTDRLRNCQAPEIKANFQVYQYGGLMGVGIPCFSCFTVKKGIAVRRFFIDIIHQFMESPICFEFLKFFLT